LGVLVGGGTGYGIQAGRPPTPLVPVESGPLPQSPRLLKAASPVKPLDVDGDIRKLLIKKPKGAKAFDFLPGVDGWMPADEMAMLDGESDTTFKSLMNDGFRRAAMISWSTGAMDVRVRLVQYQSGHADAVSAQVLEEDNCRGHRLEPCVLRKIKGSDSGFSFVTRRSEEYADSDERFFRGEALARRGDVLMQVDIHSPKEVDLEYLVDIAERQWERL
jgi:hypothetical protein